MGCPGHSIMVTLKAGICMHAPPWMWLRGAPIHMCTHMNGRGQRALCLTSSPPPHCVTVCVTWVACTPQPSTCPGQLLVLRDACGLQMACSITLECVWGGHIHCFGAPVYISNLCNQTAIKWQG